MVVVHLSGGLGNQLFQYAVGRHFAHMLNTELKLDLSSAKVLLTPKGHTNYRLGDFCVEENIATPEEIDYVKATGIINPSPFAEQNQQNIFIAGHWMHSEESFADVADIIRREFSLKNPLHPISAAWEKKISAEENSVALHIRHGDYAAIYHAMIAGLLPLNYYKTCVARLKEIYPNIKVFVFSDDQKWTRENLKLDVPTEFVTDCESDNEEFYLISRCKHNVIANSTFSWWAAWLNPNPDKKVFVPTPWTRSTLWTQGFPADWTQIPVDFEDQPIEFPPLLSIIVHVRNNAANLPFLLGGILSQSNRNFELIIIDDASDDGSENIYRQIATQKKITLLKMNRVIGRAAAWNLGLAHARGEYVMFLGGDDLILPDAVQMLCVTYSSFSKNLIFAVRYLEENPEGNVYIGGLENRKFSLHVDEQFKTLNAPAVLPNIDSRQGLLMTSTQAVNNLLSTKFFKREFLEENSLRFSEKSDVDSQLLFLANAVALNGEVILIPDVFYITPRK